MCARGLGRVAPARVLQVVLGECRHGPRWAFLSDCLGLGAIGSRVGLVDSGYWTLSLGSGPGSQSLPRPLASVSGGPSSLSICVLLVLFFLY